MREKILFNDKWLFHLGDIKNNVPTDKGPIYVQSKTERMKWGPACKDYRAVVDDFATDVEFNVDKWENVELPHDYIIKQTPYENENNALGYFKYENAWYRKEFLLNDEDKNSRITLLFEGIATISDIYVNGCIMKHNFCGYNSFEVDITDVVKFNEKNVISVYVSTEQHEGWWYEGAGIYRNVWLVKTNRICVDLWGVYAAPKKLDESHWSVDIETEIRNDTYDDAVVNVKNIFYDGDKRIAMTSGQLCVPFREVKKITLTKEFENPHLWDIDDTHMYNAVTVLETEGKETDRTQIRFGFREFIADADKGLFLNGRHIKIKGVCAHQDFGLTGKAVPDNILRYKVEMIKEMGANGYRCSHYPHPEATMDALDELGFIVMDEVRWFDSSDEGMRQLEMLIKRDRNRPSVLFWSIGNEEPHHITEEGRRICKSMMSRVKKLDNTRIITSAVSNSPDVATVYDELEAIGINYNLDKYDKIHEKYPDKPVFSSECCATSSTRGWYYDDFKEKAYLEAYDKDTNEWFRGRENTWKFITEREWVLGEYQWIAFEHRGECMWPRLCSQSGAIDLFLQKKDAFYQNQSHWIEDKPIVHLMPHWNFDGLEGEKIKVFAYTNCNELELLLNSKSIGKQKIEKYGHGEWYVPYEAGELSVIAYNDGKEVARDSRHTTKNPVALKLVSENHVDKANGRDIAVITCCCIDEDGREVPDSDVFVRFHANSFGTIVGTGSDISDHIAVPATDRKMRAGRISVAVKVGKQKGDLKIYAESQGMKKTSVTIKLS